MKMMLPRKKQLSLCLILLSFTLSLIMFSCAKDITEISGAIQGVVKDYNTGALLSNCQVALSPSGKSVITGSDGLFSFSNLEQGPYTLSVSKAGYEEASKNVTVVPGEIAQVNVAIKAKSAFASSSTKLDFGDLSTSMELFFFNNSDESCTFSISNIPMWASFSHTSGTVAAGGNAALSVLVNRDGVDYGTHTQIVKVDYQGKTSGNLNLTIQIQKVHLTTPVVTIEASAENITQNEFIVGGELKATGGAEITSYGHCWALNPNPTIDNYKTDNGATTSTSTFKSSINGLTPGTSYYVRAYATNQYGTSYSSQIVVTTQEVTSDKWDGTLATSFAGGSGTAIDPYIIKTGGQLLLIKDYNDKFFKLANNIDLNNKNWLPFNFYGTLDGGECTISNLSVSRSTDGQGLFSQLGGYFNPSTVKNLTLKNVNIVANSSSYIGSLAGKLGDHAQITNCHVVLTEKSQIVGNENVGGLVGGCGHNSAVSIVECTVDYSGTATDVIKGYNNVGGIIGFLEACSTLTQKNNPQNATENVKYCKASVNIRGNFNVGGVIGQLSEIDKSQSNIYYCSYKGTLTGEECVGGIIGYSYLGCVNASKADVDLTVTTGYGGGIIGAFNTCINTSCYVVATCYSTGNMKSSSSATSYGGLLGGLDSYYNDPAKVIMSYSTIVSSISQYDGIAGMGNYSKSWDDKEKSKYCASTSPTRFSDDTQGSCKDITNYLKGYYLSEYDTFWNYKNPWTWSGAIGGNQVKVSCPKLSWE